MKEIDEKKSALPAWKCVLDAHTKSAANIDLFTDEQQRDTAEVAEKADAIYTCKGVYINFRKNICVVKVDRIFDAPTSTDAALALQEFAESVGFEKAYIRGSHSLKFTAQRRVPVES